MAIGAALPADEAAETAGRPQLARAAASPAPTASASGSNDPRVDALGMMEVAFVGNHSRSEIKRTLDEAMNLFGLPVTEINYRRAGSVLVVLRKEAGPSEMHILSHMIRSHVPGVNLNFSDAAALSATFITFGDE